MKIYMACPIIYSTFLFAIYTAAIENKHNKTKAANSIHRAAIKKKPQGKNIMACPIT